MLDTSHRLDARSAPTRRDLNRTDDFPNSSEVELSGASAQTCLSIVVR
jgi:hypothetical protein